jgi:hypothetical protein
MSSTKTSIQFYIVIYIPVYPMIYKYRLCNTSIAYDITVYTSIEPCVLVYSSIYYDVGVYTSIAYDILVYYSVHCILNQ